MAKTITRVRRWLNKAEEEYIRTHAKEDIEVIYNAIPDVTKRVLKRLTESFIKSEGTIKQESSPSSKIDDLMGKNETFNARTMTAAASELADANRKNRVKSLKEICKSKSDSIFIIHDDKRVV
jgi:hypothetical protein